MVRSQVLPLFGWPTISRPVRSALASSRRASRRRRAATRQPVGRGMVGISTDHFFTRPDLKHRITGVTRGMPRTIQIQAAGSTAAADDALDRAAPPS